MKKNLVFLLLFPIVSYCQELRKTYYDPLTKAVVMESFHVIPNTGTLNGDYKSFDEDGTMTTEVGYINGNRNGQYTEYFTIKTGGVEKKGKLGLLVFYKNGLLDGKMEQYDYVAQKKITTSVTIYKENDVVSTTKFDENGKIVRYEAKNGDCYGFYDNGNKMFEYHIVDNLRQGLAKDYYENGKIKSEIIYKNDIANDATYYDENGDKLNLIKFDSNISGEKDYFYKGSIIKKIIFNDQHCSIETYDSTAHYLNFKGSGTLLNIQSNIEYALYGDCEYYWSNGKIKYYGEGSGGYEKVDITIFYDENGKEIKRTKYAPTNR